MTTMYNPASPGELLREFLGEITATRFAEHIGVTRATISRILNVRTAVTADLSIDSVGRFRCRQIFLEGSVAARSMGRVAERPAQD